MLPWFAVRDTGTPTRVRITLTANGPADPDAVWERYAEPSLWSSWSPQVRHVTPHDRIHARMTGRVDLVVPFTVLDVDEAGKRWAWVAGTRPFRLHLEHRVLPHEQGTRTTLLVVGPAVLVLPYAPLAQLAINRLVS